MPVQCLKFQTHTPDCVKESDTCRLTSKHQMRGYSGSNPKIQCMIWFVMKCRRGIFMFLSDLSKTYHMRFFKTLPCAISYRVGGQVRCGNRAHSDYSKTAEHKHGRKPTLPNGRATYPGRCCRRYHSICTHCNIFKACTDIPHLYPGVS